MPSNIGTRITLVNWHNCRKDILSDGLKMLAPGGQLIYSTCTWSPEENEGVVAWILENYPDLELVAIPKWNGMSDGIDFPETARNVSAPFQR